MEMIVGRIMMPRMIAAARGLTDEGHEDDDPHEAVNDRRDPGQELDDRLDDAPHALGGELRQDDGAREPERDADDQGASRDVERADDHRPQPEELLRRVPAGPGQEALQAVAEHDRRPLADDEDGDDEEDRDRGEGNDEQGQADEPVVPLEPVPAALLRHPGPRAPRPVT
jgi:hypothetical protein